ncbi:MAG: DNA gyrase inhibitor YacG [Steroidobacteraceae bacterium]
MPTLNCPTCQKPVEWSPAAKWRPFCSERCRLIDLGAWMTEQHSIPGEEDPSAFGDPDDAGPDDPPRH